MPIRTRTCHTLICDVCAALLTCDDAPVHADSTASARQCATELRWLVTADGTVVCPTTDAGHRAAVDAYLPRAAAGTDGGPR